ncbi:MAG TPA: VCBS repeat-containing protein, partial [Armatimonadota bacterium]|nr:VCBS repeat-containing protein [Armatimonadota bacterium]
MSRSSTPPVPPAVGRAVSTALLVALLGGAHVLARAGDAGSGTPTSAAAALAKFGFSLRESAKESGIDFIHQAPGQLDAKLERIMPQIASMGAAASVADFDNDGWDDLYVCNSGEGSKNHLYRNLGNGKFEDVAERVGLADLNQPGTGVTMGAVWGDYDNDGWEDLY